MNSEEVERKYYGDNYDKAIKSWKKAKADAMKKFLKENPDADVAKFKIFVYMKKSGEVESTEVDYIIGDDLLVDISTETFKSNPKWLTDLQWLRPWGGGGTVQNFSPGSFEGTPNEVKAYVTNDLSFSADLKAFDISNSDSKDFKSNSYLASLYAAYVATYLCGMSAEHFEFSPTVPGVVTSLARYHLYYHMQRFLRDPSKMSRYLSADVKKVVADHRPVKLLWDVGKFHQGQENLGTWLSSQPRGTIRNARPVIKKNAGQVGIRYDKLVGKDIVSLEDYKMFIAPKSGGLTKTGQLLFQQSMESYVYCILGAQARTRWPIVGFGTRSYQTQEVFRKLVGDTVVQDDHTVTLRNMRGAIKTTNVVLDTAVSPGMILVPGDMIILEKMVAGYNNVLTTAKSGMKFGRNKDANYFKHDTVIFSAPVEVAKKVEAVAQRPIPRILPRIAPGVIPSAENLYVFLFTTAVGGLVGFLLL